MIKDPTFTSRLRWFAGELLVVIVGVLIAVALNGRFEARKSHERETADLKRLSAELRETEVNLQAKVGMMRSARRGATALLRGFSAPEDVTRDSLVWWVSPGGESVPAGASQSVPPRSGVRV